MRPLIWARALGAALAFLVAAVAGGEARASSFHFFAEVLTSEQLPIFSDRRASIDLGFDFDPFDITFAGSQSSPGLGNGYVSSSNTLAYSHHFNPAHDDAEVLGAWLIVSVIDDGHPWWKDPLFEGESAIVTVENGDTLNGQATLNLFFKIIDPALLDDRKLDIAMSTSRGDYVTLASALKVKYRVGEPVPEPSAMLVFGIGIALTGFAAARRRGRNT